MTRREGHVDVPAGSSCGINKQSSGGIRVRTLILGGVSLRAGQRLARGPGGARAGDAALARRGGGGHLKFSMHATCALRICKLAEDDIRVDGTVANSFQVDNRLLVQFPSHSVERVVEHQDLQSWIWSYILKSRTKEIKGSETHETFSIFRTTLTGEAALWSESIFYHGAGRLQVSPSAGFGS